MGSLKLPFDFISARIVVSKRVPHPLVGPCTMVATVQGPCFLNLVVFTVTPAARSCCRDNGSCNAAAPPDEPADVDEPLASPPPLELSDEPPQAAAPSATASVMPIAPTRLVLTAMPSPSGSLV